MALEKTGRNSAALREMLFEQIDGVRNGSIDPKKAKTVASLAMTIIKSVEVEMQFRDQQIALKKLGESTELGVLPLASLPQADPPPTEGVRNPIVPQGPRFVAGRAQSGSR